MHARERIGGARSGGEVTDAGGSSTGLRRTDLACALRPSPSIMETPCVRIAGAASGALKESVFTERASCGNAKHKPWMSRVGSRDASKCAPKVEGCYKVQESWGNGGEGASYCRRKGRRSHAGPDAPHTIFIDQDAICCLGRVHCIICAITKERLKEGNHVPSSTFPWRKRRARLSIHHAPMRYRVVS
jgi:hypothetical protein